ncbi:hypothetical protein MMC18_000137 [Xylographa bjoerkii]|nr:hypothetical protein [Xylographa bjoerkii]
MLLATHCPSRIHHIASPPPTITLLGLPPEIRTQIVSYLILSSSAITIHEPRFNRHSPPPLAKTLPRTTGPIPAPAPSTPPPEDIFTVGTTRLALLLTCRLFYNENWKTYYSRNTFFFSLSTLPPFLDAIPSRCRDQIRRLSFRMPYRHRHARIWQMLSTLKRLEELELWLHPPATARHSEWESCAWGVRDCERLRALRLRREQGEGGRNEDAVLEKDKGVEEGINAFLRERLMERGRDFEGRKCPAMLLALEPLEDLGD